MGCPTPQMRFSIYTCTHHIQKLTKKRTQTMDYSTLLLLISFVWTFVYVLIKSYSVTGKAAARLPPGPYPFPVIGNILALGEKPHESLYNLSKTYGPLMSLKLGSITTVVVSSPKLAREILQTHDQALSSRTIPNAVQALDHHKSSIVFLPALSPWRKLRKMCKEHLFCSQSLNSSQGLRQEKVQQLLRYVQQRCDGDQPVEIAKAAFTTSLNLISNTFFSLDMADYNSSSSQDFKDLVWAMMEHAGKPNLADYFPVLQRIDPQGIRRRMDVYFRKLIEIFDGIIKQRVQSRVDSVTSRTHGDFLEVLLNLGEENDIHLSCNEIKHFLLDLFVAATDTTSSTVEWGMTELLRHPDKMAKAQAELKRVVGKDKLLQEPDVSGLPYLQAVVKETLRLHPPVPFLVPHKAVSDVEICGSIVPKNAQILVNVWAIGRDNTIWANSDSFLPERFLELGIDFRGQDFELIPFGAGRRICPGLPLAHRIVHFVLGSLLHSFRWKLGGGMKPEDIDMGVKFGITLQKTIPLEAISIKV